MSEIRIEYLGGPLDGAREMIPALDDGPPRSIRFGYINAADLVPAPGWRIVREPIAEELGTYRWLEHVEPFDGEVVDRYVWRGDS